MLKLHICVFLFFPYFGVQACKSGVFDIAFVIDESASVGSPNFQKQLQFIVDIVLAFTISPDHTQVGAVAFNENARVLFHLNENRFREELQNAIYGISYQMGGTSVGKGISLATESIFLLQNGDRPEAENIIIFITDGNSDDTVSAGVAARAQNITVLAIGVDGYLMQDLLGATGSPNLVFTCTSYDVIKSLFSSIVGVFPCEHVCNHMTFGNIGAEFNNSTLIMQQTRTSGQIILLSDEIFHITCCGVISSIEMVPVAPGMLEILILRLVDNQKNYKTVASFRMHVEESHIGFLHNVSLHFKEKVGVQPNDIIGWFSTNESAVAAVECLDTPCPLSSYMDIGLRSNLNASATFSAINLKNASSTDKLKYAIRIKTETSPAPRLRKRPTLSVADHKEPGHIVGIVPFMDTGNGELTKNYINDSYFFLDNTSYPNLIRVKTRLQTGIWTHKFLIKSVDVCDTEFESEAEVAIYNQPPVISNFPVLIDILETHPQSSRVIDIVVIDEGSNSTGYCCSLVSVQPTSSNFRLIRLAENYSVFTSEDSAFDPIDIASRYRLQICCSDEYSSTLNFLEIQILYDPLPHRFQPPEWFAAAICFGLAPLVTMAGLGVILCCITEVNGANKERPKNATFSRKQQMRV